MEQPTQMIEACLFGFGFIILVLCGRYIPLKDRPQRQSQDRMWVQVLVGSVGLRAAGHFSQAFDLPQQMSLRSQIINWGGLVIFLVLLIRWYWTVKQSKPGAA